MATMASKRVVSENSNYGYTASRPILSSQLHVRKPAEIVHIASRILIRSRSSHPWRLKRMKRIDGEISGHQPGITASNFDLPSILPAGLPLKPPDSLQKFVV
jgi:hypothetical protein